MKKITIVCAVLLMALTSAKADWVYDFYAITSNTNAGYQSVVAQMSMELVSYDSTSASLLFSNSGSTACTVEQIFFQYLSDAYALGAVAPANWSYGTPPPNLPGADGIFTADFYLEADPPPSKKGIELNETLAVTMTYGEGFDILTALNTGDLQVGLHTINIIDAEGRLITEDDVYPGNEHGWTLADVGSPYTYSESSLNIINIPEPASMILITTSAMGLGFIRRRIMS